MDFKLNDVEEVNFSLDLIKFEEMCAKIQVVPRTILEPYRTEVRIRRNKQYIVGAQVVRVDVNLNNESSNTLQVKCTGYLNLFKDRYITAADFPGKYIGKTYAQIARNLIVDTQAQTYGSFGVTLGVDTASATQNNTRTRLEEYDNQNVKDAILNLTKLENDNFDFEFTHDKVFNIYTRLGSNMPEIELVYPQNVFSMSYARDATTLANKVIALGSGIGEERLEYTAVDATSAASYAIRERTELFSSVQNLPTLQANANGALAVYKDMDVQLSLNLNPGSLDINSVGIGDAIIIRIDDSTFINDVNGLYRIVGMDVDVDINTSEDIAIKVVKWS
jgi:hypothetical protein